MELTWGCARRPLLGGTDPGWQLDTICMRNGHKEKETRNENPRPPPSPRFQTEMPNTDLSSRFGYWGREGRVRGGRGKTSMMRPTDRSIDESGVKDA